LLAVVGCGPRIPPLTEVEGTVRLNGKPLCGVQVEFAPDVEVGETRLPFSAGMSDESGRFQLVCEGNKAGAVVGKHTVVVRKSRHRPGPDEPPPPPGPAIPSIYQSYSQTPIHLEVKQEQRIYDLELKTQTSP
jgi:hypothetical protein